MKKIQFTFILLISFCANLFAQKDSVRNVVQQRQLYFSDSTTTLTYNFSKLSPLFINNLMPKQTSRISIGHQLEKGKFVEAQGSTQTNTAFLSSEGVTELKGIRLFGSFYYKKVFEDSTRFAHQTRNNTTTPYYYGSPANNHYERSIYDFKVLGAKNILSDKFTVGLGLDYHIADHFSNNDPRGSVKEYQLNTKASLSYNFNQNIRLGLGYLLGYGQEKVTIGYKNRTYYESLTSPTYVNYLINGYGEPIPKTNKRNYNDFQNRSGMEASFEMANTKFGSFYLHGSQVDEKQVYDYRTGEEITELSHYNLSKLNLNLLWIKPVAKGKLSTHLTYENLTGEDYNLNYLAKNYLFTGNELNLNINYTLSKSKTTYNYLIGSTIADQERIDGITGNKVYFKNILFNAGFGFNHQIANHKSFGLSLGANYGLPLADSFMVSPANESYFTKYVIFHNYLYNTASRYGGTFSGNYSFPFYNTMQAAVAFNFTYSENSKMKNLQRSLVTTPGNDRFFSNISFNLYF
ncbi:DUF6850 family outer membrane beta-barrel protein [Pedobacter sp. UC225_65]|uniref:DUF6850 family outer membrane beta-barrel protein n=1 Tax=Pedobacter sp. UC225_65 TaxID=3350173 RepID=UPI00366D71EA